VESDELSVPVFGERGAGRQYVEQAGADALILGRAARDVPIL